MDPIQSRNAKAEGKEKEAGYNGSRMARACLAQNEGVIITNQRLI